MKPIQIQSKLDLLNTWAIDRTCFSPDASRPPACLRCGQSLDPVLAHNALILNAAELVAHRISFSFRCCGRHTDRKLTSSQEIWQHEILPYR